jgi:hypothetical protein
MKKEKRICIYPLIIMGILLMLAISCKKDENNTDYASKIIGTYNGTITLVGTGSVSGSSTLTRSSDKVVDLEIIISSTSIPLPGITVSSSGSIYNLNYGVSGSSFTGKVDGNTLTWTLTAGSITETFTGTK